LFRASGEVRQGLVEEILTEIAFEDMLWEAPQKSQQVWFVKLLGANVNLGNIAPSELIPLETIRLGLRGDTFNHFLNTKPNRSGKLTPNKVLYIKSIVNSNLAMEFLTQFIDFFLHLDKHLFNIVEEYGTLTYVILFLIVFTETGLVIMPLLPGDSLLFAAGAIAANEGYRAECVADHHYPDYCRVAGR
jgi:hypothetical protein